MDLEVSPPKAEPQEPNEVVYIITNRVKPKCELVTQLNFPYKTKLFFFVI
jgi:hypothetical protein